MDIDADFIGGITIFKIITIPFKASSECFFDDELNKFTIGKNIKYYKAELISHHMKSYWTVFIEYDNKDINFVKESEKIELTENQKELFELLKNWRKEKSQSEGIAVFIIATNKQLTDIAVKQPLSKSELNNINGFGKKKVEKYGEGIISKIKDFQQMVNENNG